MELVVDARPDLSETVLVPAGPFLFGEDLELVYLPPFEIDRYPVTVRRYALFVAETGHRPPCDWAGGNPPEDRLDHPVTGINFFDALACARHAGRVLPTEKQWEKAARGTDGRPWPWGPRFDVRCLNSRASRRRGTTPVDRHPNGASPFGIMDMSGNVWEWTDTWYDGYMDLKVLKGGCHALPKEHTRLCVRHFNEPSLANHVTGFRTALPL